jgi:hypothetical protein
MKLRELAHSRTGDKGPIVNISVIARQERHYALIERHVTAERVKAHLADVAHGEVVRYTLPHLGALNFVLHRAPADTVTRSLALDSHGKSLSSALLAMEIPDSDT